MSQPPIGSEVPLAHQSEIQGIPAWAQVDISPVNREKIEFQIMTPDGEITVPMTLGERLVSDRVSPQGIVPSAIGQEKALAARILDITGIPEDENASLFRPHVAIFAGDNAAANNPAVTNFPSVLTDVLVASAVSENATVGTSAMRASGIPFNVINVGLATNLGALGVSEATHPEYLERIVAQGGSGDYLKGEYSLTTEELQASFQVGAELAQRYKQDGVTAVGVGEFGIGNSVSAAILTSLFTDKPIVEVMGVGATGDPEKALSRSAAFSAMTEQFGAIENPNDNPLEVLASFATPEIATMAAFILHAAQNKMAVILEGAMTTAAALAAVRINPSVADYLIATVGSSEKSHAIALDALCLEPITKEAPGTGEGYGVVGAIEFIERAFRKLDPAHAVTPLGDMFAMLGGVAPVEKKQRPTRANRNT